MLLLERRVNERIFIGDDIVIQVCRFGPGKVWLGIQAPKDVKIHREEVLRAIQQEEQDSCNS